ncbi:hypothetical protein F5B22DRAFT_647400 [Xylaria bambusicola]|uniref:uncharacterized protein n=1 Tax=Xylaria bambusicola TaxID=326684 RepID=UPI0020077C40|nr:uncharacterized protein F5B22DRAFT_647400 [Xylaria bambusicola]KAI0514643.1 hypothetical protein F5B22DRAFT_647400 [Xylaria bambusicola]
MQFKVAALSLFAAAVTAQNSTSLPELVSNLPTCAIPCFESGASAAGCSTTDFDCLCGSGKDTFVSSAGTCVVTHCDSDELSTAIKTATQLCTEVSDNPDPSEVASASAIITSALGAAEATSSSDPDSAAYRPEISLTFLGAIAALLAL